MSYKDALCLANNKCALYKHLKDNKIEVPEFYIVNNKTELEEAVIKLNYGQIPVIIKPCIRNGSCSIRVLDGKTDRFDFLNILKNLC